MSSSYQQDQKILYQHTTQNIIFLQFNRCEIHWSSQSGNGKRIDSSGFGWQSGSHWKISLFVFFVQLWYFLAHINQSISASFSLPVIAFWLVFELSDPHSTVFSVQCLNSHWLLIRLYCIFLQVITSLSRMKSAFMYQKIIISWCHFTYPFILPFIAWFRDPVVTPWLKIHETDSWLPPVILTISCCDLSNRIKIYTNSIFKISQICFLDLFLYILYVYMKKENLSGHLSFFYKWCCLFDHCISLYYVIVLFFYLYFSCMLTKWLAPPPIFLCLLKVWAHTLEVDSNLNKSDLWECLVQYMVMESVTHGSVLIRVKKSPSLEIKYVTETMRSIHYMIW